LRFETGEKADCNGAKKSGYVKRGNTCCKSPIKYGQTLGCNGNVGDRARTAEKRKRREGKGGKGTAKAHLKDKVPPLKQGKDYMKQGLEKRYERRRTNE